MCTTVADERDFLRPSEVARLLGCSEATVRRDKLPIRMRIIPGVVGRRYHKSDVLALKADLERQEEAARPQ